MTLIELVCQGLIFCSLLMLFAWLVSLRTSFYSLVDALWAYGTGALVLLYAVRADGVQLKKIVAVTMALLWSLRLGTHLALRLRAHYPTEDKRYISLKRKWKGKHFFLFFQIQALSMVLFSLPFLFIVQDSNPIISKMSFLGFFVFAAALIGESLADAQLRKFRSSPTNGGRVCDIGLWKYSRHPNYFFEWLIWCGIALVALPSPSGYFGLVSPLLMYLTLNYWTGAPALEEQSLQSSGDAYRNYQKKTNRFFPGAPL